MIRAVLTDFDGTLMPLELVISLLKEAMKEHGINVTDEEIRAKIIGHRIMESLPRLYGVSIDEAERIRKTYHNKYLKVAPSHKPLPGVYDLFKFCKEHNLKTGIVSTKASWETKPIVEKLGFTPDVQVYQDDVKKVKPDPEPVEKACAELGIPTRDCAFVGDHVFDVIAGKRAGAVAIGVLTGLCNKELLARAGADLIFPTLVELIDWLKKEIE